MKRIGIIGAMPEEVAILRDRLGEVKHYHQGGIDIDVGSLDQKEVVLCCCGMGKSQCSRRNPAADYWLWSRYGH